MFNWLLRLFGKSEEPHSSQEANLIRRRNERRHSPHQSQYCEIRNQTAAGSAEAMGLNNAYPHYYLDETQESENSVDTPYPEESENSTDIEPDIRGATPEPAPDNGADLGEADGGDPGGM